MILAGDIGGTHVRLALFERKAGGLALYRDAVYASRDFPEFSAVLPRFLDENPPDERLSAACFGVAGPVLEGRSRLTNLPWQIDVRDLRKLLGLERVLLINDLAALAAAVPFLDADQFMELQAGTMGSTGNIGVLASGTGLGQSFLIPDVNGRYRIVESEGGHADLPACPALSEDLFRFLRQDKQPLAIEDVLSGAGLVRLHAWLRESGGERASEVFEQEIRRSDPAAVIIRHGLAKQSQSCENALTLFMSFLGAVAGNLALQTLARGGIFVGGGMVVRLISLLHNGEFIKAFRNKGKFREFMETVPVRVVTDDRAALLGAAHFALGDRFVQ